MYIPLALQIAEVLGYRLNPTGPLGRRILACLMVMVRV